MSSWRSSSSKEIDAILRLSEGKTLEFKRDASSSKQILKTLVAFANSAGGKLVIGSRNVVGVPDPRGLEERLASLVADSIEPRLLPDIEVVAWRDTQLLVVEVHPSALRPHFIKAEGGARGTYVRLGSTNRAADAPLIAEPARGASLESYDEQPLSDLDSEVMDFAAASQSFEGVRTLRRKDLVALGVIRQVRAVPRLRSEVSSCSAATVSPAFRTPGSRSDGSQAPTNPSSSTSPSCATCRSKRSSARSPSSSVIRS